MGAIIRILFFFGGILLLKGKFRKKIKLPESIELIIFILLILSIPYTIAFIVSIISFLYESNQTFEKFWDIIAFPLFIILLVSIPVAFLIFIAIALKTLDNLIGIKGKKPKEIYNSIIENDISKVADKIMYLKNKGVNNIIEQIKNENMENKKTKLTPMIGNFALIALNKDPWALFHIPNGMEIKEENNEIIINYKKLKYNVNKGKYL